uniref:Non-structural protein NS-S n=1 Tax=Nepuyo virus TaxID=348009 RepID=A0A7D9MVJ2_9VIRU|nr:NSs [Nepuyo virus]
MSVTVLSEVNTESCQLLCLSFQWRNGDRVHLLLTLNRRTRVLSIITGMNSHWRTLESSCCGRMRLNRSFVRVRQRSLILSLALGRSLLLITITRQTHQIQSLMVN